MSQPAVLVVAIVLMVGSAPELSFMVLVALGFMLYLAPPGRRWSSHRSPYRW